jgi:glycerol-3-phosphate acyltransferase PlsX
MGGDFAPDATLAGALLALQEFSSGDRICLVGDESYIRGYLQKNQVAPEAFDIVHANEVIEMGEHPIKAYTKKQNSSIAVGFSLLKHGKIDAFASAGNSGAVLVGSIYSANNIPGVIRPATSTLIPQENGAVSVLLDIGTNPDARPDVMVQFAILGTIYAKYTYGIDNPRVGLLNIGEEEEKGNLLSQSTFHLLQNTENINFIGNIESRDLFKNKADVIVCDGFTGNVVLKLVESFYRLLAKRDLMDDFIKRLNYEQYGGTPILGVNGTVILGHGISNDIAIKNMILQARNVHSSRLPERIHHAFEIFTESQSEKPDTE